jgi:hypothetical protein
MKRADLSSHSTYYCGWINYVLFRCKRSHKQPTPPHLNEHNLLTEDEHSRKEWNSQGDDMFISLITLSVKRIIHPYVCTSSYFYTQNKKQNMMRTYRRDDRNFLCLPRKDVTSVWTRNLLRAAIISDTFRDVLSSCEKFIHLSFVA